MSNEHKQPCPEFPFFGARYPDATCIDGFLWDLDKYEDGQLYGGGEIPCPFCNTEACVEYFYEDEGVESEEDAKQIVRERIFKLKKHHGYE